MTRRLLTASILICWACSADPLPPGHYVITTGRETDTYSRSPVPTKYTVSSLSATSSSASLTEISTSDKPIGNIQVPPSGSNWYSLEGEDADGIRRVQATSFPVSGVTMAGYDYLLFAGRTDAFCRPPGALLVAQGDHPPVGLAWGRYLWVVGGNATNAIATDSYDLISWSEATAQTASVNLASLTCSELPCAFQSFAMYASYDSSGNFIDQFALGIGSTWADGIDMGTGTTQKVNAPAGLSSWADLAGGRTFTASSGASYIVGATRSSTESAAVLEIATDATLNPRPLSIARLKAAANYVAGWGLIVIGGSSTAPGVEVLAPDGDKFTALTFPPDEVQGAALVPENLTSSVVWRIGGRKSDGTAAPSVAYDLACTQNCTAQSLSGRDIDAATAVGYGYKDNRFVVGEQDDGTMVAWRVTDSEATPIPQREPRKSATVANLPNGFIALVGGTLVSDGSPAMNLELVAY